ncbi:hypothetical protein EJC49_15380 [Aquibium carbonis]|jgi:predicted HTH domain antitoxin|uniref:Uncharacterized protein n=1 Tax=Aquibium carbonis TaxID=2495581 RepID=A0A429YVJ2_9HYPH|nr:hypothetical protein [Aquibium carbonis]RST85471.1 hypothetical protein EJC49_15380 [Aquibium carbonis]
MNKNIKAQPGSAAMAAALDTHRWRILAAAMATASVLALLMPFAEQARAETAHAGFVYTADEHGNSVSRIDLASGKVDIVPVAVTPHNVEFVPKANKVLAVGTPVQDDNGHGHGEAEDRPLRKARLYRKDAVEAFRRGYVSSTEAATILRTHARIVHHELRWEGIRASLPLPPERLEAYLHRKSALKWFLRAEVEALALRGGITRRIKRVPRTGNPVAVSKASSDPGSNSATLSG